MKWFEAGTKPISESYSGTTSVWIFKYEPERSASGEDEMEKTRDVGRRESGKEVAPCLVSSHSRET